MDPRQWTHPPGVGGVQVAIGTPGLGRTLGSGKWRCGSHVVRRSQSVAGRGVTGSSNRPAAHRGSARRRPVHDRGSTCRLISACAGRRGAQSLRPTRRAAFRCNRLGCARGRSGAIATDAAGAGVGSSRAAPADAHSMSGTDVGIVLVPTAPVSSVERVRLRRAAGLLARGLARRPRRRDGSERSCQA
jgi:hypothetical protein